MSTTMPATAPELRRAVMRISDVECRDTGSGDGSSMTLIGHAAVYDQETTLYDGGWWRLRERIAPGAFSSVLARLRSPGADGSAARTGVHLNVGHDMTRAIARTGITGIGGMDLTEDEIGLRVFARLDPTDPDVVALAAKMRNGIVDQMSFAFTVADDERVITTDAQGNEDELRTILDIGELYDVTVCAQGAYPQTDAALRSLAHLMGRAGIDPAVQSTRGAADDPQVTSTSAPADPVVGVPAHRLEAARIKVRALTMAHAKKETP